jgi:outer membrane biosynthesis protein TonB
MSFNRHIVISAALCTPVLLLGCGTLGTYHPKPAARPVTLSSTDLIEARKTVAAKSHPEQPSKTPETTLAGHRVETEQQVEISSVEFTTELLPIEFEEI